VSELSEALAQKVEARLAGSLRRLPSLAHEVAYETEPGALRSVCHAVRETAALKFEMQMELAGVEYIQ